MKLSDFGERFTARTGILELMEDLGKALNHSEHQYMLGGGNPALIPEMTTIWRQQLQSVLDDSAAFERMVGYYDTERGNLLFCKTLGRFLNQQYGWKITERNIVVTNGSQSAFFFLLNMYAGTYTEEGRIQKKQVLFPISPEYIGYADQGIESNIFTSRLPIIDQVDDKTFKYRIDFEHLNVTEKIGAICISRPTNPSGNVVTNMELDTLSKLAAQADIPLLIDNAYGQPFPGIVFEEVAPIWNEHIVLGMSLSKLGLPSARCGIILANEELAAALSAVNAICALSTGNFGQIMLEPLIRSGKITEITEQIICPFYKQKAEQALEWIHKSLADLCEYRVHKHEGAFFLWIWFRDLPITTARLYDLLKEKNVLVLPGHYFFYGLEKPWTHSDECIRLNYSLDDSDVKVGIETLAETIREL